MNEAVLCEVAFTIQVQGCSVLVLEDRLVISLAQCHLMHMQASLMTNPLLHGIKHERHVC